MNQIKQLLDIVRGGSFLVLDTETTGLGGDAEICQIAIIDSSGETLLDTLVKPTKPIPAEATAIHGITNEMVANAPSLPVEHIFELLSGQQVIVYNVAYDTQMLYKSVDAAQLPQVDWNVIANWYCAMEVFAEIYDDWNPRFKSYRWQTLTKACLYYGIPLVDAHNALQDCLSTLEVCRAMARRGVAA